MGKRSILVMITILGIMFFISCTNPPLNKTQAFSQAKRRSINFLAFFNNCDRIVIAVPDHKNNTWIKGEFYLPRNLKKILFVKIEKMSNSSFVENNFLLIENKDFVYTKKLHLIEFTLNFSKDFKGKIFKINIGFLTKNRNFRIISKTIAFQSY